VYLAVFLLHYRAYAARTTPRNAQRLILID
jgi:hypothetical protein